MDISAPFCCNEVYTCLAGDKTRFYTLRFYKVMLFMVPNPLNFFFFIWEEGKVFKYMEILKENITHQFGELEMEVFGIFENLPKKKTLENLNPF